MRILLLTGNHPRHLFYASAIIETGMVNAIIRELREEFIPVPPLGIDEIDRLNFIKHFASRKNAEEQYFLSPNTGREKDINLKKVTYQQLNNDETARFDEGTNPDLAMVFGTGLIKEPLLSVLPRFTINLHLGLSPWYKGSATLFWPFYNLEPQFAGTTFHIVTPKIDGGEVISQTVPALHYGDGIHDVGAKAVIASAREAVRIIEHIERFGDLPLIKQKRAGRLYLTTDFIPAHLRLIYQVFDNKIVDHYLHGRLSSRRPELIQL